jgi:hypothetical protein
MSDDEVEITGAAGFDAMRDAPHARCHCLVHPFKCGSAGNATTCAKCLCFVCEEEPAKCTAWAEHCGASDVDPKWINERRRILRRRAGLANAPAGAAAPPGAASGLPAHANVPPHVAAAIAAAAASARTAAAAAAAAAAEQARAENEQDEHEENFEEVFATYTPRYVTLGSPHPDPVCETTSLAFAALPVPSYSPSMNIAPGALSTLQAETLVYACQRFEVDNADGSRGGFFLGDGVGLGKGRQLAAIINENWLRGRRRSLWLSVSSDLITDAKRDLTDIGSANIPLHALNKLPYGRLDSKKVRPGARATFPPSRRALCPAENGD